MGGGIALASPSRKAGKTAIGNCEIRFCLCAAGAELTLLVASRTTVASIWIPTLCQVSR